MRAIEANLKLYYWLTLITFLCTSLECMGFQLAPLYHLQKMKISRGRFINSSISRINMMSSADLDGIESSGIRAAENWDFSSTLFMSEEDGNIVEERLAARADVGYIRVGGLPSSLRTRFVMTNPDLDLERRSIEAEYCIVLCIDNIHTATMRRSSPWPHVLTNIGVKLENVGDVVVDDETSEAYMIVAPSVAKQCSRLLPKELRGVGITVSTVEPDNLYLPIDGIQQDMELGKLDKRALKYK